MKKGLFTSQEEIIYLERYVKGNVPLENPDPNARRNPAKTLFMCSKKSNKRLPAYISRGRIRY